MLLKIKQGLDIPLSGKPEGTPLPLASPQFVALNLDPFEEIRFKVLVKPGERVKIGQPLAESKNTPGMLFVSTASGEVAEIRRGIKRRLLSLIIKRDEIEEFYEHGTLSVERSSREDLVAHLLKGGIFPHIRMRPFDLLADPQKTPRAIFVRAIESLPYAPPAELQVKGHEEDFELGLRALSRLTSGKVHLVYRQGSKESAFFRAEGIEKHPALGPHPIGNASVHIHHIDPILSPDECLWTLSTVDCIAVGKMLGKGRYHHERVISVAGNGVIEGKRGFFKGRGGVPLSFLFATRLTGQPLTLISGDPLIGQRAGEDDFLGFYHTVATAIPENRKREPLHFLRLGLKKYSAHRAYFSGHFKRFSKPFDFTTNLHGEERPFIDGAVYNKVMPMEIPTALLVKAVLAEDFERAEKLGLLEVAPEDFALPTFICPSKVEMIEIIKQGLHRYAKEMGH